MCQVQNFMPKKLTAFSAHLARHLIQGQRPYQTLGTIGVYQPQTPAHLLLKWSVLTALQELASDQTGSF